MTSIPKKLFLLQSVQSLVTISLTATLEVSSKVLSSPRNSDQPVQEKRKVANFGFYSDISDEDVPDLNEGVEGLEQPTRFQRNHVEIAEKQKKESKKIQKFKRRYVY